MERPAGLGRSLEDVLHALAPVDPDASSPGRILFEPDDVEHQLDQLVGELRELNDRVEQLVGLVPDAPTLEVAERVKPKRKKGKKKRKKHEASKQRGSTKKRKKKSGAKTSE